MIGQKNIIKGWPKMYETLDTSDTLLYAHDQWKTGVLIECGKHDDNSAVDVAYNTIENAMKYL
ncbi:MAG: hypothetical protein WCG25_05405 [bacterium]